MNEKVTYWLELAAYDLATARAMLDTGRYLYVGFMCHQVIEKVLKAYFVQTNAGNPPYTHNLRMLARDCGLYEQMTDNQKDTLEILEPLNIEARYPTSKEKLLGEMTVERSEEIIRRTEALYRWIKELL